METILPVYFLQQWFDLSDPTAEDMLYDSESMRRFARVELGEDAVPEESTILRFRHLLEQHYLAAQIFATVRALLEEHKRCSRPARLSTRRSLRPRVRPRTRRRRGIPR